MDHILVSRALADEADPRLWILHRYSEYPAAYRATDHDPLLAAFALDTLVPERSGAAPRDQDQRR